MKGATEGADPRRKPIPASYWLPTSPILAGEYPGHWEAPEARRRLRRFFDVGVTAFLDLTRPEDGLEPYRDLLVEEADSLGIEVVHAPMPIPDMGVPTIGEMAAILDRLDEWAASGRASYVHCWGGIGRTGTVVGCHLVRTGIAGAAALATVQRLYETTGKHLREPRSPQTEAQRKFIIEWAG